MYKIIQSTQFKKDFKLIKKQGYDIEELKFVVAKLANKEKLDAKFKDHKLSNN